MADTSTTTPGTREAHSKGVASSILLDIADTTWRLFVPTIGAILVGRYFDSKFGSQPWLMLGGAGAGAFLAALLVWRQIRRGGVQR